jgi:hypothetical protein
VQSLALLALSADCVYLISDPLTRVVRINGEGGCGMVGPLLVSAALTRVVRIDGEGGCGMVGPLLVSAAGVIEYEE